MSTNLKRTLLLLLVAALAAPLVFARADRAFGWGPSTGPSGGVGSPVVRTQP